MLPPACDGECEDAKRPSGPDNPAPEEIDIQGLERQRRVCLEPISRCEENCVIGCVAPTAPENDSKVGDLRVCYGANDVVL